MSQVIKITAHYALMSQCPRFHSHLVATFLRRTFKRDAYLYSLNIF